MIIMLWARVCHYTCMYSFLREWWWPWKGPTNARHCDNVVLIIFRTVSTNRDDTWKYKLIIMSGSFSRPPSLSQERIYMWCNCKPSQERAHGVTVNPHYHLFSPWKPSKPRLSFNSIQFNFIVHFWKFACIHRIHSYKTRVWHKFIEMQGIYNNIISISMSEVHDISESIELY